MAPVKKIGSVILFDNRLLANNNMEIHSRNSDVTHFKCTITPNGENI